MASTLAFVLAPEDENELFALLARHELTVYPERIPPGYVAPKVAAGSLDGIDLVSCYLAAENLAPLYLHTVKRGKDAGSTEIDENQSPVIHYHRSVFDEDGALRSGRMWMWLDMVGDSRRNPAFPEPFRRIWVQIRDFLHSRSTKSQPAGYYIGPHALKRYEKGTVLREAAHRGRVLKPYRKG